MRFWFLLLCAACARPTPKVPTMPEFALVFHVPAIKSSDRLAARNAAAREWALARQRDGLLVHALPFEVDSRSVEAAPVVDHEHGDLAAVLVVTARDLEAATALARSHPGLAYGTRIEVRPIKRGSH